MCSLKIIIISAGVKIVNYTKKRNSAYCDRGVNERLVAFPLLSDSQLQASCVIGSVSAAQAHTRKNKAGSRD